MKPSSDTNTTTRIGWAIAIIAMVFAAGLVALLIIGVIQAVRP